MAIRKVLMILIIVYGTSGISQCLTIHLIIGIETVLIIIQKPFKQMLEFRIQIIKRVLLLVIVSLFTLITYSSEEDNNDILNLSNNIIISVLSSICLIAFLVVHVLYFLR